MRDELRAELDKNLQKLVENIDVSPNLLLELKRNHVLSRRHMGEIEAKQTITGKKEKLLDLIKRMDDNTYETFREIFSGYQGEICQKYLPVGDKHSNAGGRSVKSCIEMLTLTNRLKDGIHNIDRLDKLSRLKFESTHSDLHSVIRSHYNTFVNTIHHTETMAKGLHEENKLSYQQLMMITEESILLRRNETFLNILLDSWDSSKKTLMDEVQMTKQDEVAVLFFCDDFGFDSTQSKLLQINCALLLESIDASPKLLKELCSNSVLTENEMYSINESSDYLDQNEKLLCIISRKSKDSFDKFINVLLKMKQQAIVEILQSKFPIVAEEEEKFKRNITSKTISNQKLEIVHRKFKELPEMVKLSLSIKITTRQLRIPAIWTTSDVFLNTSRTFVQYAKNYLVAVRIIRKSGEKINEIQAVIDKMEDDLKKSEQENIRLKIEKSVPNIQTKSFEAAPPTSRSYPGKKKKVPTATLR